MIHALMFIISLPSRDLCVMSSLEQVSRGRVTNSVMGSATLFFPTVEAPHVKG